MDYGNLLSRAWRIVWNNKFMFVLGFLAALGSGGGGANFNYNMDPANVELPPGLVENIERMVEQMVPIFIGLACLGLLLGLILWLVRLTAQAAMIDAAARLDEGQKVTFGQAFAAGTAKLVPMALLNLLLFIPFILVGFISLAAVFGTIGAGILAAIDTGQEAEAILGSLGVAMACLGALCCLLVPLYFIVMVIYPFAQRGIVLQNLGAFAAAGHGWRIVKQNLTDILLLIVLFIFLGFLISALTAVVAIPIMLAVMGPTFFQMFTTGEIGVGSILTLVAGGICLGILGAIINAILIAFRSTTVTLAYQEFLMRDGKAGKIAPDFV